MSWSILTVTIKHEQDVVAARQRARQIANLLGFDGQDQSRIATAVSEIARNAYTYAGGGVVEFRIEGQSAPQTLVIEVKDQGPGISELERILRGQYRSATGMGLGIVGMRRLMDTSEIVTAPGRGTRVSMQKGLSKRVPLVTPTRLREITAQLASARPRSAIEEIQQQNGELLRALDELRQRNEELVQLNHELEDTNRGVIALTAELDEKALRLKQADAMKSRFLSNMSHEFRTPLNSILALSQLLLNRADGDLTEEQEKQVNFIRKSATGMSEMVSDLLDLAKIEAGKVEVHPTEFTVENLFSALRGVFRPLLSDKSVDLIFEEVDGLPPLLTDEGKVTQILRNFISNALKYTESGEVRVSASVLAERHMTTFIVADTGIGISPDDQSRIFEEFTQVENILQRRAKGTGLGLPLCRRLATLLGGYVAVESEVGVGSTFSVTIPLRNPVGTGAGADETKDGAAGARSDPSRPVSGILLIDDDDSARYLLKKRLGNLPWPVEEAASGEAGISQARELQPRLIVLDLNMPGMNGFETLNRLKSDPRTSAIPVVIITSQILTAEERENLMARTRGIVSKESLSHVELLEAIKGVESGRDKERAN
jgi:signal transduction histidine kinase/CheY-like chemotaxis protein